MVFLLSSRLKLILLAWMIAETLVFVAVVETIGIGGALLAGLLTSFLGAFLLKRMGRAAMERLRGTVSGRAEMPGGVLDGTLQALAAAALLVPGFLSDVVGLALYVPPVRAAAVRRLQGGTRRGRFGDSDDPHRGRKREPGRHEPGAIDLSPEEWSSAGPPSRR